MQYSVIDVLKAADKACSVRCDVLIRTDPTEPEAYIIEWHFRIGKERHKAGCVVRPIDDAMLVIQDAKFHYLDPHLKAAREGRAAK